MHRLQSFLSNVSFSGLSISAELSQLYRLFVYGTYVFLKLCQFWNSLQSDIAWDSPYIANIGGMRLRLFKLQENVKEAKLFRGSVGLSEDWEDVEEVLQYRGLPYIPEIICSEVISYHHDDLLIGHFDIDKIKELIGRKYYWPSLKKDVKSYVRGCDVCLALKAVRHKLYGDLQSLPIPTHWWKDFSMDFVTRLPLSSDWKGESYNFIPVIVNQLTKMVHYKLVKVTINALGLAEVIIDVVV